MVITPSETGVYEKCTTSSAKSVLLPAEDTKLVVFVPTCASIAAVHTLPGVGVNTNSKSKLALL